MQSPEFICLLRLSALGDVTHVVPLIRTLQKTWPRATLVWVVGKAEHRLLEGLRGVELIEYDKRSGLRGMLRLRETLSRVLGKRRRFDVLMQMQVSARANLLSLFIPSRIKIGYDKAKSKEAHSLVINRRIPRTGSRHVLDVIGSFCEPLGIQQTQVEWDFPLSAEAQKWAQAQWPVDNTPTLLISPCSSHQLRNWRAERYAAVADHAINRGWRVVLCGGRSDIERQTADAIIAAMRGSVLDLVGKDTLKQLPALLARADLVMAPDSGPMHIANAVGTKVLGLHAATDSTRSGPYSDRRYCVDRYEDAAQKYRGKSAVELRWGSKIEQNGVMDLITVEDAIASFERYVAHHTSNAFR